MNSLKEAVLEDMSYKNSLSTREELIRCSVEIIDLEKTINLGKEAEKRLMTKKLEEKRLLKKLERELII